MDECWEPLLIKIIADDLTGAADAVAPFAPLEVDITVAWGRTDALDPKELFPRDLAYCEALALDTETRDLSADRPAVIVARLQAAAELLRYPQTYFLYKKIDSTLRGHLGLELGVLRKTFRRRMALVCPAFPAHGRTVENGVLHIHGRPWMETDFAPKRAFDRDVPTVRDAFDATRDSTAAELRLEALRGGPDAVRTALNTWRGKGVRTVFCDAVLPSDLEILAEVLFTDSERYLPVGSGGLAAALAARVARFLDRTSRTRPRFECENTLVVVGSRHPASRRQAAFLAELAGIRPVRMQRESSMLFTTPWDANEQVVLLMTEEDGSGSPPTLAGCDLKAWLLQARRQGRDIGLVLTGGATALDALNCLSPALRLWIKGELEPGIVLAALRNCDEETKALEDVPVMLKAGGFGDERTLARCIGLV